MNTAIVPDKLTGGIAMQATQRRQRDPLGPPPDLSPYAPYRALEIAQLGLAQARLARDRTLIQAWSESFDAAYAQCVLTGVVTE